MEPLAYVSLVILSIGANLIPIDFLYEYSCVTLLTTIVTKLKEHSYENNDLQPTWRSL